MDDWGLTFALAVRFLRVAFVENASLLQCTTWDEASAGGLFAFLPGLPPVGVVL